jgi:hypothetical protein
MTRRLLERRTFLGASVLAQSPFSGPGSDELRRQARAMCPSTPATPGRVPDETPQDRARLHAGIAAMRLPVEVVIWRFGSLIAFGCRLLAPVPFSLRVLFAFSAPGSHLPSEGLFGRGLRMTKAPISTAFSTVT